MRLSAYVLAYRLSQVVAAANERLARMSDRRYSLEHTGRRGAGETRGGLSLLVRDDVVRARRATRPPCPAARRSWCRWRWPSGSPT